MATEIVINKHALQVKQYNGQMVVTFKDIDLCHGRPEGTASRNFRVNKQHFIEGTDYFSVTPDKFQLDEIRRFGISSPKGGILITESGYYMIVKSFTDELSWAVQRELVNSYFKYKAEPAALVPAKPYEYFDKTWKGEPVLTARDVQHMTGICRTTVVHWLRHNRTNHVDYYFLKGGELLQFKAENPRIVKSTNSLCVVTKSGFAALCKAYCIKADEPKCFDSQAQTQKVYTPNGTVLSLLSKIERAAFNVEKHRKEIICCTDPEEVSRAKALLIYAISDLACFAKWLGNTTT